MLYLVDALKEGTVKNTDGYHFLPNDPLAIEVEHGIMLMDAIIESKPEVIVEIGTGRGYSTAWMSLGIIENGMGKIYSFDREKRDFDFPEIERKANFYYTEFKNAAKNLPPEIDFVFHDAEHRYENIIEDLSVVLPRMAENSQIWIHDVTGKELPGMMKEFFEGRRWDFRHFPKSSGMGVARKVIDA